MADSPGGRPPRPDTGLAATIFGITVMVAVITGGGFAIFFSVQEHGDAARSSYTQAHGTRVAGRVISERTSPADARDQDKWASLTVLLSSPVSGHDTTTVHIQGTPVYSPGTPVTIVVDPQDPGYAELPGAPYNSGGQWLTYLAVGLGAILVGLLRMGLPLWRQSRSRLRLRRSLLR